MHADGVLICELLADAKKLARLEACAPGKLSSLPGHLLPMSQIISSVTQF